MLTILIFSLMFAQNHLSSKDPLEYTCHVEDASEISGSVRNLNVFLEAPEIAEAKEKLSRTQKVITLECLSLQRPVQINMYLKMYEDLKNKTAEECTLQSLKVITSAGTKSVTNHTCVLLIHHRKQLQRKFFLTQKVFLPGISNCATTVNLPKMKAVAETLTVQHVHLDRQALEKEIPSTNDKDMANRLNLSIIIKMFIVCITLALTIPYFMFVIFEIPFSCLCNSARNSKRRLSATCALVHGEKETLPFLKGSEQTRLEALV